MLNLFRVERVIQINLYTRCLIANRFIVEQLKCDILVSYIRISQHHAIIILWWTLNRCRVERVIQINFYTCRLIVNR